MKKLGIFILSISFLLFCNNERDARFRRMKECMQWNDPKYCSQMQGVPYQQGSNGSYLFWHNNGWYYPHSNGYYNYGAIAPSSRRDWDSLSSRYGSNTNDNTVKSRINSIRSNSNSSSFFNSNRPSYSSSINRISAKSYTSNNISRGGFGSKSSSFSSGGRS